jgi:WD40 repeat protein
MAYASTTRPTGNCLSGPVHTIDPLRIFDTASAGDFEWHWQCKFQGKKILSTDFSPMGEFLALGSADGQLSLWKYGASSSVSLNKVR